MRPQLLVSVRSVAEAEAALSGGAAIIDIKEPAAGPLGKADDAAIRVIVQQVNRRRPVSAALGELIDWCPYPANETFDSLAYLKWGLAACRERDWRALFAAAAQERTATAVLAAYADWQEADAPSVDEICEFACARGGVLLIDTYRKQANRGETAAPHLLSWLSMDAIAAICQACRKAGVAVALAGSLNAERISVLKPANPDWFAVRGAVCEMGRREGAVSAERVRELAAIISK